MYEFMTGIKYLNFIADIFGIGAEERVQRINKYADMFELTASLAQPVSSYSHGMKQKLAVIAAWIHSPEAYHYGRAFCRARSQSSAYFERTDAGSLQ